MADTRKIIWTASCPVYPLRVTLDSDGWAHALDGHSEIAPHQLAARDAIESPSTVYNSAMRPDSVVFFNHNVTDGQGWVLSVPVLVNGYEGIVTSVHFRPANYSGKLIWKA